MQPFDVINKPAPSPVLTHEAVREALEDKNYGRIRKGIRSIDDADIAVFFRDLTINECIMLFRLIPRKRRATVFSHLDFDRQEGLLEELPDVVVISVLNEMEPVDRTQLLESLDPNISNRVILKLKPEERQVAWQLLSYPEDSVGRLMTPEFIPINASMSVGEAIEHIRWTASNYPEDMILHLFVVDEAGCYVGEVSLASLFIADPRSQPVRNLMETRYQPLSAMDDQEVVVDAFRKYDRSFMPVVDERNILQGVVLAESAFDAAEEEASEDIQQFGGAEALEESYFQTQTFTLLRKRAGWLAVLFVAGVLTGEALKMYEATFEAMSYLVFFLPLIISSGGNSGSQAASLIIRGIAVRDMEPKDWRRVLARESVVGASLGLILGSLGFICAKTWGLENFVGIIVFFSLIGVVIFGAIAGSMLPFLLKKLKFDPAVCSSPLVASLVDVFGILIFFNIAIWIDGMVRSGAW